MEHKIFRPLVCVIVILFVTGCGTASVTPASENPTFTTTPIPPTKTPAPSATPTTKMIAANPSPRMVMGFAYDSESDKVIMFGGQTGVWPEYDVATWVYDVSTNTWTDMKPDSGPKKNAGGSLAYDAESDRVVMYGGANEDTFNVPETWAYDYNTNTWQQMAPGPEHHLGGSLAYDAESDRIILFGGYRVVTDTAFDDTWAYDFNSNTWTEMKPSASPPAWNYDPIAYDAESDRVILFGVNYHNKDASVWAYDYNTNTWQQMPSGPGKNPGYLESASMTYDTQSDRIILYGGAVSMGELALDKTWAYDYNTNTWTEMEPVMNPGPLEWSGMTYSSAADLVILFGGMADTSFQRMSGKTWTYDFDANTWSEVTPR